MLYKPPVAAPPAPRACACSWLSGASPLRVARALVIPLALALGCAGLVAGTMLAPAQSDSAAPLRAHANAAADAAWAEARRAPPRSPQVVDYGREEDLPDLRRPDDAPGASTLPLIHRHYRMFFAVISSQRAVDAEWRAAARKTWLRLLAAESEALEAAGAPPMAYRFFVGDPDAPADPPAANDSVGRAAVAREMREYGDLVVLSGVPDTYKTLTAKTASVDNDVFVYVSRVLERLSELNKPRWSAPAPGAVSKRAPLYYGAYFWSHRKRGSLKHKNYEAVWPLPVFPPYASGPFYVMDARLAALVSRSAPMLRKTFTNEDAAVGIWLSILKLDMVDDKKVIWPKRRCWESLRTKQVLWPEHLHLFMNSVLSGEKMCTKYKTTRT
eukprot:m51a1_g8335 putative galactosyltransferase family protein (385) ;mRNA; r:173272-175079